MIGNRSLRKRRLVRALWRDTRALVGQFRVSLAAFLLLIAGGTLAFRLFYQYPDTGRGLSWIEALHTVFLLIFLEAPLPFPSAPGLQLALFVIPIVGLLVAADGIVRFSVALFNRRERREAWEVAIASTYRDHVVVCGLGRIGYRVVKELLRLEEDVIGVELDTACPFLDEVRALGVPVIIGDVRHRDVLEKAVVRNASAIAICTADDLSNLNTALEARELNPGIKVVLRMFDAQLAEKVQRGFGIHTTFSTSALAAPVFAAAATRAKIDYSFYMGDVLLNVARSTLGPDSALAGETIEDAERRLDITIMVHERAGQIDLHPVSDVVLQSGDGLVVMATRESLARLREIS